MMKSDSVSCVVTSMLASAALLAGCESAPLVETSSVAAPLPPLAQPQSHVGDEWHYVNQDGEAGVITTTAIDGGTSTMTSSLDGCSWTMATEDFAPAYTFSGCSGSDGSHDVERNGTLWPLRVGVSMSFDYEGRNNKGHNWSGTRRCEVLEEVAVTTAAGDFDTFHVQCVDHNRTRDWYVSASDARAVLFTNRHRKRNTTDRLEMTHFVSGAT